MAVTDFFAGEIASELLKMLISISRKSCLCRSSADQLLASINSLLPIIEEIKHSGVELPEIRQFQLNELSERLRGGTDLARKVLSSGRWNVYKNLMLARKMEKLEKHVSGFVQGPMQAHILADVHHLRFHSAERFDRLDGSARLLEERLGAMKIGGGGWVEEAVKTREEQEEIWEADLGVLGGGFGLGLHLGKTKVKEKLIGSDDLVVVGVTGIGGSGKTTLARELARDTDVQSYFGNRILFLTVSQSPDVRQLLGKIQRHVSGSNGHGSGDARPQWTLQYDWTVKTRTLVVLDDVWSLSHLEQLICRVPGCKTLVVSRSRFPSVFNFTYEIELLKEDEAMSLFCLSAFGKKSIPPGVNQNLIKQLVNECKGLPLALKVLGASLHDQPEMIWACARNRLLRGEPANDTHENKVLKRMEASLECLPEKVKECFLDLGSFPEDKKIPLDVLINMWVEIHDIDEEEAFAILVDLSNKNLLTLVKDSRAGDMYSSYYEIAVTQHDVLRDLAIHLSSSGKVTERKRLLMPRRDAVFPKEWERNSDEPFNAQIVSIHTDEMQEMDWPCIDFPKAEVLILNFASSKYFLPPFIDNMPKLRALIVVNYGASNATLSNFTSFANLANLRSLWLEKVSVPQLSTSTVPMRNLRKMSLVLCKINNSLDQSAVDLPQIFPRLSELTIDHSDDLMEVPSTICGLGSLKCLSITNCHSLHELPPDMGKLKYLEILRLFACPNLKTLPPAISELTRLKYLDVSQCVNLTRLPQRIGDLSRLEKIDMRDCLQIMDIPISAVSLQSLHHVICDEEISWQWKDVERVMPALRVQVPEKCYSLDWLDE